jgi:MSHA biogenesis protein MshJ
MSASIKQRVLQLAARIDALSLRERGMVFGATIAVLAFAGHTVVLAPQDAKQAALRTQIEQQQAASAAIDGEITARVEGSRIDPDAQSRTRLNTMQQEMGQLGSELLALEHGLVPPERMGPLVEGILRANGRLKLVSMRTLPAEPLAAPGAAAAPAAAAGPAAAPGAAAAPAAAAGTAPAAGGDVPLLYRHGVEVTVRGNYLDMVDYMSTLDAMPTRMFWGRAQLDVETYPTARLTLTLHTLSLDRQWMKL